MINKIYKRIHNKYSKTINFFFFLRYVFIVFFVAISLFFSIPKFFNYEKKDNIINQFLFSYYDLKVKNYSAIEFIIFPFPHLSIKNVDYEIRKKPITLKSKNINIFLDIKNIYNFKNFKAKKIVLNENKILLDVNEIEKLINYIKKLKYKLDINNLNIDIKKSNESLIKVNNINFSNYGYRKFNINGKIFDKKFKVLFKNNNKNLKFKLLDTGIKADIKFNDENLKKLTSGSSKISFSKNLLKFNFYLDENKINVSKSNFRNKYFSFSLDSLIKFNPFFSINSKININEINEKLVNNLKMNKILKNKELIKKINGKFDINYKNEKYFVGLIKDYSSDMNLSYGSLFFSNKILIEGGKINCNGESRLIDEYPRLDFKCLINLDDKKKIFKKFLKLKNVNNKILNMNIEGSINLINKKIKFKNININENYLANEEDMKFFKEVFERTLFDEGFFMIFNKSKIKAFILEII